MLKFNPTKEPLSTTCRGLRVQLTQQPNGETWMQIKLSKTIAKPYANYLNQLLQDERIKGIKREVLEETMNRLTQTEPQVWVSHPELAKSLYYYLLIYQQCQVETLKAPATHYECQFK